ncbi:hypothetical protein BDN70DRAFT_886492 [Pholiota conissans]|uniref:F-box domain-containing protein n=1 Tax=Pholiota conissans TaxID=109636 RepID=A0A9P6CNH2_9AGAR|nr:hypothetical protein BDN70DRAFT_886492 [Pholiota conissans]
MTDPNECPQYQVFRNEDLLELIFSLLDPEAYFGNIWDLEPSTRQDLLSAALTCKAFLPPAMSLLWRMMESLLPLLKLIPSFTSVEPNNYAIEGPVTLDGLNSVITYGSRIRYLCISNFFDAIKADALLNLLATTQDSLLPNLKSIYIPSFQLGHTNTTQLENLNVLFLAYSRFLTAISIHKILTQSIGKKVSLYLSALAHNQMPVPVDDIELEGRLLDDNILNLLPSFRFLKFLTLDLIGVKLKYSTLLSWSGLSSLTRLEIHMDQSSSFGNVESHYPSSSITFKTLRHLILDGSLVLVHRVLRTINNLDYLSTIDLTFNPTSNPDGAAAFPHCLKEMVRISPLLKNISLQATKESEFTVPADISALYDCSNIEVLNFARGIFIPINDVTIGELSSVQWSSLRELYLPAPSDWNDCPSLLSIGVIARNFPHIIKLKIYVDFDLQDGISLASDRKQWSWTNNALSYLHLVAESSATRISGPLTRGLSLGVARYIEHLFPNLEARDIIHNEHPHGHQDYLGLNEWWEDVVELISEFRALREEIISDATN